MKSSDGNIWKWSELNWHHCRVMASSNKNTRRKKKNSEIVWDVASYCHVARVSFNGIMLGYKPTLVGGWAIPLKNMSSWVGIIIPNIWKQNVPNHQPATYLCISLFLSTSYPLVITVAMFFPCCRNVHPFRGRNFIDKLTGSSETLPLLMIANG